MLECASTLRVVDMIDRGGKMSLGDQAEDRVVAVMKRFLTRTDARTTLRSCVIIQLQVMNWLRAVGYRGQRFTAY